MKQESNDEKILEFVVLSEYTDISKLLEDIRKDNHIPIIQALDMDIEWNPESIMNGFNLDMAYKLMDAQILYENYEGAAFIKDLIDQIKEEFKQLNIENTDE